VIARCVVASANSMESHMISRCRRSHLVVTLLALASCTLRAQSDSTRAPFTGEPDLTALAKASQNPLVNMTVTPIQSRFGWNTGPDDRFHADVNLLPAFPTPVTDGLLLVPRFTMPFVYQSFTLVGVRSGIGDAMVQLWAAPRDPGVISFGLGPALVAPTASSKGTGQGKWSGGPTAALVATPGPWVAGILATQLWSFAGQSDRPPVSSLTLEPFVNYNMPGGWSIISRPIVTADFEAPSGEQWTLPVGAGMSKTFAFWLFPMSFAVAGYGNVIRPSTASTWELRLTYALLFPK